MTKARNSFLIDVLSIFPENTVCFIQAPSIENAIIERILESSEYDYYKQVHLTNENKLIFIEQELKNALGIYIQNIQIKQNEKLLFEGFDKVEYGILSSGLNIPKWFKDKYIPSICIISDEW
jgi:hypothetical protein